MTVRRAPSLAESALLILGAMAALFVAMGVPLLVAAWLLATDRFEWLLALTGTLMALVTALQIWRARRMVAGPLYLCAESRQEGQREERTYPAYRRRRDRSL